MTPPAQAPAGKPRAVAKAVSSSRVGRLAQGERSREEILDAAELLMSAKGYAATSMSDLVRESGLPPSSIYWHFGSKRGVVAAVMERGARRFFDQVARQLQITGEDPRERLGTVLSLSDQMISEHPQFLRLFMLLLLGSEGGHAQDEVVSRVRAAGHGHLANGVRLAYLPWGEELAERIAAQLGDVALAMFDGYFIAIEAGAVAERGRLIEQLASALHALAVSIRDSRPPAPAHPA
jgi:AcrR family transcriptional regulator